MPSLRNIFLELKEDVGFVDPGHGCLMGWARQGLLLLNATLTVRAGKPGSHHGKGWETFTDAVIRALSEREEPLVFLLWGKSAQEKFQIAAEVKGRHAVLTAAHPSPYSAANGFFGCRHFSKTNDWLTRWGKVPVDWQAL